MQRHPQPRQSLLDRLPPRARAEKHSHLPVRHPARVRALQVLADEGRLLQSQAGGSIKSTAALQKVNRRPPESQPSTASVPSETATTKLSRSCRVQSRPSTSRVLKAKSTANHQSTECKVNHKVR
eukprot:3843626-Rhodomonas_salina.1